MELHRFFSSLAIRNDRKIVVLLIDGLGGLSHEDYDYKTVWGDGGHTGKHGGSILPDSMRWLWRDTPPAKVEAK